MSLMHVSLLAAAMHANACRIFQKAGVEERGELWAWLVVLMIFV